MSELPVFPRADLFGPDAPEKPIIPESRDVIILGGGVAGLTAASLLSDENRNLLLLESGERLGGTHRSLDVNGYTFDIGSFFFYSSYLLFRRHPQLVRMAVPAPYQAQRVDPCGMIRTYPFSPEELKSLSFRQMAGFAVSLLSGKLALRSDRTVKQVCYRMLGRAFYEYSGLANYVARFYGPDLPDSRISPVFVDKRMRFIKNRTRPAALMHAFSKAFRTRAPHGSATNPEEMTPLIRPESGFDALYAPLAEDLRSRGVTIQLNSAVRSIVKRGDGFVVTTSNGAVFTRQLVSTLPLETLLRLIGHEAKGRLSSGSLLTLCVSFAGHRGFDASVLYNFHASGRWKRLTMHSDFYGMRQGREYFSVEIPVSENHPLSGEDAFADFADSARAHGLFAGGLELEETVFTPFAYPRYELGYEAALAEALAVVDDFGIVTAGRQGRFDYLPTSGSIAGQVADTLRPMMGADALKG